MYKKVFAIITLIFVSALLLSACGAAEKFTEYDLGADKVSSVVAFPSS